jgi:hypothetical protein
MNGMNTPGVETVLNQYDLSYIPEAHCMLQIDGEWFDFTTMNSNAKTADLEKDILMIFEIRPEQVITEKIEYHQKYIQDWILQVSSDYSFDEIWSIREKCIAALESGA